MEQKIRQLYQAFNAIHAAKGNEKLPVIREVCQDAYVKQAVIVQLNPFQTFGMKEKSMSRQVGVPPTKEYTDLVEMCEELSLKRSINDSDIANVQLFLRNINDDVLRDFARSYITKSITIGATGKTINKALGEKVVPLFECMLANKYFEHQNAVCGKMFAITEKLDGIRCIAVLQRGKAPVLYSRQGQLIEGLTEIEEELSRLTDEHSFATLMLDGELLIENRDNFASKDQYKKTTEIVRRDGEKIGIAYHVFDAVRNNNPMIAYASRRDILTYYIDPKKYGHVRFLPVLYAGDNPDMIIRHLNQQRALGHEGVMINLLYAPYEYKRTNNLLKCKVMQDCDLQIIGFQEGSGKYAGSLGALIVDYKGLPLGVGSGLSDSLRQHIWENQDAYIGRVATVQYFEETHDAQGNLSLRFPVLKEIREEGKEVSYN